MKNQTRNVRLAIKNGNEIIADFKQHTHGKLNLWVSITDLSEKYNITAEAHSKFNPGVYTTIAAQLPFSDFTYDEFVEVLMAFQKEWDIPVLTHAFPKKKLFNLRQKYGARIIRDDIVRKE
ncbi:transposase [Lactiplantibacillus plantarum]|uniref:transposase n=1 Tax=Lactiplantibacillus plantarum TaxID=1590 RepID=UPI000B3E56D8|nr:transposase [Lactiplantibacillus plantarum]ARW37083.1 hypothetical protein S102022_03153 [Lactiplantibacillus plantarum]